MNKTTHTPGPWILNFREEPSDKADIISSCGMSWDIATVIGGINDPQCEGSKESIANAKLIAASPDLLEALQEAQKALQENYPWPELHAKIQAAIDKATT